MNKRVHMCWKSRISQIYQPCLTLRRTEPSCTSAAVLVHRPVKGFLGGGASNFTLSHRLSSSPLQHSRTTMRVCDTCRDRVTTLFSSHWCTLQIPTFLSVFTFILGFGKSDQRFSWEQLLTMETEKVNNWYRGLMLSLCGSSVSWSN